jgi:large subunit ribosomal protein L17
MRHRNKSKILDRPKAPRELMIRNLAASILIYEKVKTTKAKAKTVQPLVEKVVNLAKKGDLTSRRRLIALLPQKLAVKKAMEVLGSRFKDKKSGYTRLVKIGQRQGDGAEMVQIELV